jgi:hypothetical protein
MAAYEQVSEEHRAACPLHAERRKEKRSDRYQLISVEIKRNPFMEFVFVRCECGFSKEVTHFDHG